MNNEILILNAFRDEKDIDKWLDMGFEDIMETIHIKLDYYKSYVALYDNHVDDFDTVLENLKKSTYQVVGSYIFSAFIDYTKNEGMGPFSGEHGHEFFSKCLDILQDKFFELVKAHKASSNNRGALEKDNECGCFSCLAVYSPLDIYEWCCERKNGDEVTAICPHCGIDSVISKSAGYPLTEEFLKSMYDFWFDDSKENIPIVKICPECGETTRIKTYRKFVLCPKCKSRYEFEGFKYKTIDFNRIEYHKVKYTADCPACKGPNFLKWRRYWRCEDCGYKIGNIKKFFSIFWFCDKCETFLNVQEGFTTKNKMWTCTECGYINDVTRKNIV